MNCISSTSFTADIKGGKEKFNQNNKRPKSQAFPNQDNKLIIIRWLVSRVQTNTWWIKFYFLFGDMLIQFVSNMLFSKLTAC